MSSKKDLTGQRFGRLIASYLNPKRGSKGQRRWNCTCDCGGSTVARGGDLIQGLTKSCGCLKVEKCREVGKATAKRPYESLYNRFVRTNEKRNVEVSVTYEDFLRMTEWDQCHYCSSALNWKGQGYNIDRADNEIGYTLANCIPCCSKCNTGKSNMFTRLQWQQLVWFMQENTDIFGGW
jgi:hypothetical protein